MESNKKTLPVILNFSALYAIISILFLIFQPKTMEPSSTSSILGFVSLILFISIPIVAIMTYKKQGGEISLGTAIKIGLLIGLIGGFVTGVYAVIYYQIINPVAIDETLELSREVLEKSGKFTEEQIEKQLELTRDYFIPFLFIGQVFTGLLYGLIGGVLGGLFYRPKNKEF
jgi:hypothetical protein